LNRIVYITALLVFVHAAAARAQASVYVEGAAFLDLQRGSGQTSPRETTLDATVGGGGVRVGGFLASHWSVELGVDASAGHDTNGSLSPLTSAAAVSTLSNLSPAIVIVSVDERVHSRVTATSILLGYHTAARGRVGAAFKGGMSFVHTSSTIASTITYQPGDPRFAPLLILPAPIATTSSSTALSTAATVGAELTIALTPHAALIPEMRAFGVDSRIFLRPGAGLRWLF
jgi:hypothetical protein